MGVRGRCQGWVVAAFIRLHLLLWFLMLLVAGRGGMRTRCHSPACIYCNGFSFSSPRVVRLLCFTVAKKPSRPSFALLVATRLGLRPSDLGDDCWQDFSNVRSRG